MDARAFGLTPTRTCARTAAFGRLEKRALIICPRADYLLTAGMAAAGLFAFSITASVPQALPEGPSAQGEETIIPYKAKNIEFGENKHVLDRGRLRDYVGNLTLALDLKRRPVPKKFR